ncbi:alpha/beta hydrolase [Nocardiopsis sp. RSe5-2]|uniref:Alpha/beta hydrolase n=1 Tax=Nocardiopsis endophytica TaxID=3018445 RepID=A0ABT4U2A1_9ACTN|nr:alpha/beta hydrolase [Nocardiopsis endophytica]MDA2811083.1 alpha/beta hydrolase [Nocardiopsis endophytica]
MPKGDRGASFIEYGATVLLVAGIIGAVLLADVPARVEGLISHGVECVAEPRTEACEGGGGGSDDGTGGPRSADPPTGESAPQDSGEPSGTEEQTPTQVQPVAFDRLDDWFGDWFGGDDGPDLAPDPETEPDRVHDWWEGLSRAEREEVMDEEPQHIRNLDGVPADVRDELNREFLDEEIERMLKEEGVNADEVLDYDLDQVQDGAPGAPSLELWEMAKLQRTVNQEGSDHHILALDPEEGRSIVSAGDPDTEDNVATLVPGTGTEWTAINGQLGRAENIRNAAARFDEEADHAVVSWIGYDTPNYVQAPWGGKADDGKDDLQDFQYGLRVTHEGDASNNTLIGHSYGSVVVGHAARHDSGVDVDNIILVGSPGVGGPVEDMNFGGDIEDIHIAMSDEDWINKSPLKGFHDYDGLDHPDVSRIRTGDDTGHSDYFRRENGRDSLELRQFGRIVAGG